MPRWLKTKTHSGFLTKPVELLSPAEIDATFLCSVPPVGSVLQALPGQGNSVWMEARGQKLLKSEYPELYKIVGDHFNLTNMSAPVVPPRYQALPMYGLEWTGTSSIDLLAPTEYYYGQYAALAVSPNGRYLAVTISIGPVMLQVLDTQSNYNIVYELSINNYDPSGASEYTGEYKGNYSLASDPEFTPDGSALVFGVSPGRITGGPIIIVDTATWTETAASRTLTGYKPAEKQRRRPKFNASGSRMYFYNGFGNSSPLIDTSTWTTIPVTKDGAPYDVLFDKPGDFYKGYVYFAVYSAASSWCEVQVMDEVTGVVSNITGPLGDNVTREAGSTDVVTLHTTPYGTMYVHFSGTTYSNADTYLYRLSDPPSDAPRLRNWGDVRFFNVIPTYHERVFVLTRDLEFSWADSYINPQRLPGDLSKQHYSGVYEENTYQTTVPPDTYPQEEKMFFTRADTNTSIDAGAASIINSSLELIDSLNVQDIRKGNDAVNQTFYVVCSRYPGLFKVSLNEAVDPLYFSLPLQPTREVDKEYLDSESGARIRLSTYVKVR